MDDFLIYLFAAIGVLISIVLPILRALLPSPPDVRTMSEKESSWDKIRPYAFTALFSLISGILLYAGFGDEITNKEAIIAGYAWDSTLQKLRGAV